MLGYVEKTKVYKFFDQVKQEAKKVVWPEKKS
jgi:preprotein translocase SecE subunit